MSIFNDGDLRPMLEVRANSHMIHVPGALGHAAGGPCYICIEDRAKQEYAAELLAHLGDSTGAEPQRERHVCDCGDVREFGDACPTCGPTAPSPAVDAREVLREIQHAAQVMHESEIGPLTCEGETCVFCGGISPMVNRALNGGSPDAR